MNKTFTPFFISFALCFGLGFAQELPKETLNEAPKEAPKDAPKLTEGSTLSTQRNIYTHPGILFKRDNDWVGTDYLYNVPKQIGIIVEVIIPPNNKLDLNLEQIQAKVGEIFRNNRIEPENNIESGPNGLPFFNLLIMVYPVEKAYVALVDGRLYESVVAPRVTLAKDTGLQAITWEKKTLISAAKDDFHVFLQSAIQDIATSFADRYKIYLKLKEDTEK